LKYKQRFRKLIIENFSTWFQAVEEYNSECRPEDVCFISGCTRVRSWITGVVESQDYSGSLSLSVNFIPHIPSGLKVSSGFHLQKSPGTRINHGPAGRLQHIDKTPSSQNHDPSSHTPDLPSSQGKAQEINRLNAINEWSDQCIFIRGFRMKPRKFFGLIPQELKAAAEPRDLSTNREPGEDYILADELGAVTAEEVFTKRVFLCCTIY
jgi:hypothetical protein